MYENSHRSKHEHGHWVWILDRGRMSEYDDQGRPTPFTGTHFEITNYQETKDLSDSIQQMARIGGWELDTVTRKTRWTSETYRIHAVPDGTPTDQLMGMEFYAPHEKERITQLVQEC